MSDFVVRRVPEDEARERDLLTEADRRKGREHLRDLTTPEADMIAADLVSGRLKRLDGVRFPLHYDAPVLRSLAGVIFDTVDLPFVSAGKSGTPATISDCEFIDTRIDPWSARHAVYRGCTFDRVRIGTVFMSGARESAFESCRFTKCRISHMGFTRTRFTDVTFVQLAGTRTRWESCTLERVTMTGRLGVVHWIDCEFDEVDLSQTHLPDATVMDVRRNGLVLPEFRDGFFVTPEDIRRVLAAIRDDLEPRARDGIDRYLEFGALPLDVINESLIRYFVKASKDEAARIIDRLYPLRVTVPPVTPRPEPPRKWWQRLLG